jgi:hypothetical protein
MTLFLSDNCSVDCSCPEGTCTCQGGGTTVSAPFTGCPACPSISEVYAICNFR